MKTATLSPELLHISTNTLSPDLLHKMDAYWRAANYLSVGQIYLYDNPLLREPLKLSHVKPLLQQRIVVEINLSDRYIVGGAPVGIHLVEQFWSECVGFLGRFRG